MLLNLSLDGPCFFVSASEAETVTARVWMSVGATHVAEQPTFGEGFAVDVLE
jgi:hypothetical protein